MSANTTTSLKALLKDQYASKPSKKAYKFKVLSNKQSCSKDCECKPCKSKSK